MPPCWAAIGCHWHSAGCQYRRLHWIPIQPAFERLHPLPLSPMQTLRNAHHLARFVLVWFALTIGASIASPIFKPLVTQVVCSASGAMSMPVMDDDGSLPTTSHTLQCPLCAGIGAPPPAVRGQLDPVQPLAYVLQPVASTHITSAAAAPLPARGPPTLL